jgi:hypothetical protein
MSREGTPNNHGPMRQADNPHPTCAIGRQAETRQTGNEIDTVELLHPLKNRMRRALQGGQTDRVVAV